MAGLKITADLILDTFDMWQQMISEDIDFYEKNGLPKTPRQVSDQLRIFINHMNETYKGKEYYVPTWAVPESIEKLIVHANETYKERC